MPSRGVRLITGLAIAFVLLGHAVALAHGVTIVVTREENKPRDVEITEGDQVHWTNNTGGVAHIAFRDDDAIQFQVGSRAAAHVKFDKAGTYRYTVHVSGVKPHAHTGTITVKPR
jgi:plastocyanin